MQIFYWGTRTQVYWPIALSLSFKFIGGSSAVQTVQPPYRGPRYYSASLLLFAPNPFWQGPRSASLSFLTPGIHIQCIPTFPFFHRIFCMCESQLGALPAFCNVSYLVYLWTEHTYRWVPADIVGLPYTFYRLFIPFVSFFQSNFLFWT